MNSIVVKRRVMAFGVSTIVFAVCLSYIFFRRESLSLSNINKSFGSAAVLLAGFTLVIRPLMARFSYFHHFMTIRRELGLMAFDLAFIHLTISVFFIPSRFTIAWYVREWLPIAFGAVALCIWIYLTYLSRNEKVKALGAAVWQKHQRVGARVAFVLIYLHVIFLKYAGWLTWFSGKEKQSSFLAHPAYIPESFIIFLIMTCILFVKATQLYVKGGAKNGITTTEQTN